MKYILAAVLLLSFNVSADPRVEEECHYPRDANNTDVEFKNQNCQGVIDVDDNTGTASGAACYEITVTSTDRLFGSETILLRGDAASESRYRDYTEAANSACTMVTRNYNGDGTYNYTTYTTNDWNVEIVPRLLADRNVRYEMCVACRDGAAQ